MLGDIELNPGTRKPDICYNCSVCHWNLKSLAVYNFERVGLLNACNTANKFDIICISESYLESSFLSDTEDITIKVSNWLEPTIPITQIEVFFAYF